MVAVVVLAIILVAVFLQLDGVESLDCYTCSSDKNLGDYSPDCKEINSKTPSRSCSENQKCLSNFTRSDGLMTRYCSTSFENIRPGKCESVQSVKDGEVCVCDRNLCTVAAGGGGQLKCYDCKATKDDDSKNCRRPNPKTTKMCNNGLSCLKSELTGGGVNDVYRECFPGKIVEDCKPGHIIDKVELVTCACNEELCNSAQYLHRTSLFVIGLIVFTVLWKII